MGYLNSTPIDVMFQEAREKSAMERSMLLLDRFVLKSISTKTIVENKLVSLTILYLTSKKLKNSPTPLLVDRFCLLSKYSAEIYTSNKPPIYTLHTHMKSFCQHRPLEYSSTTSTPQISSESPASKKK